MGNGIWYWVGAAGCIVWRWMRWLKVQPKDTPMRAFWRDRMSTNVSSLIVALLLMGAYLSGGIGDLLMWFAPEKFDGKMIRFYDKWWAAGPVGFAVTFAARKIVSKFADKVDEKDED